jgi:DNA-binding NtrC family response regulator
MSLTPEIREQALSRQPLKVPDGVSILIVSDDDSETDRLKTVLLEAGFVLHSARSISAGCEAAKSGWFQVVVSRPVLQDGSWRRLTDIAYHYDLGFEVIVLAPEQDSRASAAALNDGAFDVLDAMSERPRIIETARRASWAAYLKGAGPNPRTASPQKAA